MKVEFQRLRDWFRERSQKVGEAIRQRDLSSAQRMIEVEIATSRLFVNGKDRLVRPDQSLQISAYRTTVEGLPVFTLADTSQGKAKRFKALYENNKHEVLAYLRKELEAALVVHKLPLTLVDPKIVEHVIEIPQHDGVHERHDLVAHVHFSDPHQTDPAFRTDSYN